MATGALRSTELSLSAPSKLRTSLRNVSSSRKLMIVMPRRDNRRSAVISSTMQVSVAPLERAAEQILGIPGLAVTDIAGAAVKFVRRSFMERSIRAPQLQVFIEKVIMDCRFFTLAAIAGTLIGSVICFFEGCFLILKAFFRYFHTMSQHLDQGEIMHLVIEAIDVFLFGSGMLNFGMAMYIMFVGTRRVQRSGNLAIHGLSNLSALFQLMMIRSSMGGKWVSQAKGRLGQAVVMILQAGTVDKFKSVPVTNGLDLACFAGAILFSAASVYVLSRLNDTVAAPPLA